MIGSERRVAPLARRQPDPLVAGDDELADHRAFARFAEHVALNGVSVKEGRRVIYAGWDRKQRRRVRVIVEDLDD